MIRKRAALRGEVSEPDHDREKRPDARYVAAGREKKR